MSAPFYGTFAEDHAVARLRGKERPAPAEVRAWLRRRIAWLEYRITSDGIDGKTTTMFEGELRALCVALDTYVQAIAPGESGPKKENNHEQEA